MQRPPLAPGCPYPPSKPHSYAALLVYVLQMHLIRGAKISSLSCTEMSCHYMIAMRVCGTIVLSGGKTSHENISDDQSSSPVNKPEPSRATSVPAPQLEVPSASNGAVSEFYLLTLVPTLLMLNPRPALSKEAKVMIHCTTSWTRK